MADEEFLDRKIELRGEGTILWKWLAGELRRPDEAMFEGVAGSGKTRIVAEWLKTLCNQYPSSKTLLMRETRVSLNDSFLDIWENEVLGPNHPAVVGLNRKSRDRYKHAALGGEVVLGGYDNPTKLFSTNYHCIVFNEMQETTVAKWEQLHRALRRPHGPPCKGLLLGDCNPDKKTHWANERAKKGRLYRMRGRFWDNPRWYQPDNPDYADSGGWTEEGVDYLGKLRRNLTGPRLERLFFGRWVTAEGVILEEFDERVHVINARLEKRDDGTFWIHNPAWTDEAGDIVPVKLEWFVAGQDVGHAVPGCHQIWGFDANRRAYCVAEIYRHGWDLDQWASAICELYDEFRPRAIICDNDKAYIDTINNRISGIWGRQLNRIARQAWKQAGPSGELAGVDLVRVRLKPFGPQREGEQRRGIYYLKDRMRFGIDTTLPDGHPRRTEEEIEGWVYENVVAAFEEGRPQVERPDKSCPDHGVDTTRYVFEFVDGSGPRSLGKTPQAPTYKPNTFGARLRHGEKMRKARRRA